MLTGLTSLTGHGQNGHPGRRKYRKMFSRLSRHRLSSLLDELRKRASLSGMATSSRRTTSTKRAALYVRVSTADRGQTVENQLQLLQEAAGRLGWTVVHIYRDEGISGARGRDKRPGLDALLKGVARREFDIVAAWSACRLGRSAARLGEPIYTIELGIWIFTGGDVVSYCRDRWKPPSAAVHFSKS